MTAFDRIAALPCWKGEISAEPLTGGLSNESWLVSDAAGKHVVRFGSDFPFHHVSRDREVMVAKAAYTAGFAPEVEHSEAGVMVSAFLDARTWTPKDMRDEPERIGALLSDFHNRMPATVSGAGFMFWVFHVIRDYARTLQAGDSRHMPQVPSYLETALELEAAQAPMPIIFGHNDLLPGNILDDGKRLWLIDFEYAGFSTGMFDLAGAASNAGMNDDEAHRLLTSYFGQDPTSEQVRAFDAMQSASLLREAMWAMVSEIHLSAPGVDYAAYARENVESLVASLDRYRFKHGKTAS